MASYSAIAGGLTLFAHFEMEGMETQLGGADHDIIFGPSSDLQVSPEVEARLQKLGWFKSEEYDCWAHFV